MTKAKLPSTIRVGALDFDLCFISGVDAEAKGIYGECCQFHQYINLRRDLSDDRLVDVLMHELTHAISGTYGLYDPKSDDIPEERLANVMGAAWAQIWRDNPALLKWLTAMQKKIA